LNVAVLGTNLCDIKRSDWAQARPLCEGVLARYRALGDVRAIGLSSVTLGSVLARLGEYERSIGLLGEGLAGLQAVGDRSYLLPCLLVVASVAAELGQPRRAARLLGAAESLTDILGATGVAPVNRADEALALNAMRGRLSPAELAAARAEGRTLAPDAAGLEAQATVRLLTGGEPPTRRAASVPTGAALTRREQDVAQLVRAGYTDRQIAWALGIAPGTATVHVHHILNKLRVHSRWQLVDRREASIPHYPKTT
jgi:non-specific serine/threonine protein kinase